METIHYHWNNLRDYGKLATKQFSVYVFWVCLSEAQVCLYLHIALVRKIEIDNWKALKNTLERKITDCEAAEHLFKSRGEFFIATIDFKINFPQVRSTIHTYFDKQTSWSQYGFGIIISLWRMGSHCILPERANWWPSNYLCPANYE